MKYFSICSTFIWFIWTFVHSRVVRRSVADSDPTHNFSLFWSASRLTDWDPGKKLQIYCVHWFAASYVATIFICLRKKIASGRFFFTYYRILPTIFDSSGLSYSRVSLHWRGGLQQHGVQSSGRGSQRCIRLAALLQEASSMCQAGAPSIHVLISTGYDRSSFE